MAPRKLSQRLDPLPSPAATVFRLPNGSRIAYEPERGEWVPEPLMVTLPEDILCAKTLVKLLDSQPKPWSKPSVKRLIEALDVTLLRFPVQPRPPLVWPEPLEPPDEPLYGSLTSFLKHTPEARQAMRMALRAKPPHPETLPMLAPPQGGNAGLVGTAFDYAFRAVVTATNPARGVKFYASVARLAPWS